MCLNIDIPCLKLEVSSEHIRMVANMSADGRVLVRDTEVVVDEVEAAAAAATAAAADRRPLPLLP